MRVSHLVLEETDRVLDIGFQPQIRTIPELYYFVDSYMKAIVGSET